MSTADWPKVGPVDIVLDPERPRALVELKWGDERLCNCAWDLVKLACLRVKLGCPTVMVAGASPAAWERGVRGGELFGSGIWSTTEHLDNYSADFVHWRKDVKTHPLRLPRSIRTVRRIPDQ